MGFLRKILGGGANRRREREREHERELRKIVLTAKKGERVRPKPPLPPVLRPSSIAARAVAVRERNVLREIEDRRQWNPEKIHKVRRVTGLPAQTVIAKNRTKVVDNARNRREYRRRLYGEVSYLPWRVAFQDPKRVVICLRRKARKQVLHALKLTGKGARARHHKHNFWSGISCG